VPPVISSKDRLIKEPKDVQSLQSSYVLVFYNFGFETTTLTFSRIIDVDDATIDISQLIRYARQ
jgi:hypothetical protein